MEATITIEAATARRARVRFRDVTPAYCAALQEVLLNDIPCVGIHTAIIDDMPQFALDDVLALQLGHLQWRVPNVFAWKLAAGSARPTARDTAVGTLRVTGQRMGDSVRARDITWLHPGAWEGFEGYPAPHPGCGAACTAPAEHSDAFTPEAVFPDAVLARVNYDETVSAEVHATRGISRFGPPWRCVPDVRFERMCHITWHIPPTTLPEGMQSKLRECMGGVLHETADQLCNAALAELVAAPQDRVPEGHRPWREVFTYDEARCADAVFHITTNGGVHPLHALEIALHILRRDADTIAAGLHKIIMQEAMAAPGTETMHSACYTQPACYARR